ncbi:MAG: hypothetical protein HUJ78_06790, partial [Mogibacterium sp.]|nr:hypothetical protein [Mogibacterium sp.]
MKKLLSVIMAFAVAAGIAAAMISPAEVFAGETTERDLNNAVITLADGPYYYNQKPAVTVTFEGEELVKDTDYTVTYSKN